MATVTDPGRLKYFGIEFLVYSSEINGRPIRDEANRTVVAVEYTIKIKKAFITALPPDTTDDDMLDLRHRLFKDGGPLTYQDKGFGVLNVNQGNVWDAKFGPKIMNLNYIPIGDSYAGMISCDIVTVIPECIEHVTTFKFGIMALNFANSVAFNDTGLATITTAGYIEIPMTRTSPTNRSLPDHIDKYKEKVQTPVPIGFARRSAHTKESLDKRRLDFEFVDEQLPKALFPGIVRAPIRQSLRSALAQGFRIWEMELSGTLVSAVGVRKENSYQLFMSLVQDRIQGLNAVFFGNNQGVNNLNAIYALVQNVSMSDSITGLDTDYRVVVRLFNFGPIGQVLQRSKMWFPLPGTDFQLFRASMDVIKLNKVRGAIDYHADQNADAIIDLCIKGPSSTIVQNPPHTTIQSTPSPQLNSDINVFIMAAPNGGGMVNATGDKGTQNRVREETSWLAYECMIGYTEEEPGRHARHKPMGGETRASTTTQVDATGSVLNIQRSRTGNVGSALDTLPDNIHETRAPSPKVRLVGMARRLAFHIPIPKLVSVGGVTASINKVNYTYTRVVSRYGPTAILETAWDVEYVLDRPPQGPLPIPSNPIMGITGGA